MKFKKYKFSDNFYKIFFIYIIVSVIGFSILYLNQYDEYKDNRSELSISTDDFSDRLLNRISSAQKIGNLLLPRLVRGYGNDKIELEKRLKSLVPLLGTGFTIDWAPNGLVASSVTYKGDKSALGSKVNYREKIDYVTKKSIQPKNPIWIIEQKDKKNNNLKYIIPIYEEDKNSINNIFLGYAVISVNTKSFIDSLIFSIHDNEYKILINDKNSASNNQVSYIINLHEDYGYIKYFFPIPEYEKKSGLKNIQFKIYSSVNQKYFEDIFQKITTLIFVLLLLFVFFAYIYTKDKASNALQKKYEYTEILNEALISYSGNAVLIVDESGVLNYANDLFYTMFGYNIEDCLGKNIFESIFRNKSGNYIAFTANELDNDLEISYEESLISKNGNIVPALLSRTAFIDKLNGKTTYLIIIRDITLLKAADRARLQFVSNLSHDLRTPLTAVLGYTSILEKSALSVQDHGIVERISQSAGVLLSLVNDVLDWAKIEAGEIDLTSELFSLSDQCDQILAVMEGLATKKGLNFILRKADDMPEYVIGDPSRFQQIMLNLIGNAIKFTEKGHIILSSELQKSTNPSIIRLRFEIQDTGVGIPIEHQDKLFDRFHQVSDHLGINRNGTGLGLAIVKQLAELMGGNVGVVSEVGVGSTFFVELEFKAANSDAIIEKIDFPVLEKPLSEKHILLVDDSDLVLELAEFILLDAGAVVTICSNGQEALDWLALHELPDAILMDVQMPVMDGLTAASLIRQKFPFEQLPMIAMTAGATKTNIEEALNSGFSDYCIKPFDQEKLIFSIVKNINRFSIK